MRAGGRAGLDGEIPCRNRGLLSWHCMITRDVEHHGRSSCEGEPSQRHFALPVVNCKFSMMFGCFAEEPFPLGMAWTTDYWIILTCGSVKAGICPSACSLHPPILCLLFNGRRDIAGAMITYGARDRFALLLVLYHRLPPPPAERKGVVCCTLRSQRVSCKPPVYTFRISSKSLSLGEGGT